MAREAGIDQWCQDPQQRVMIDSSFDVLGFHMEKAKEMLQHMVFNPRYTSMK